MNNEKEYEDYMEFMTFHNKKLKEIMFYCAIFDNNEQNLHKCFFIYKDHKKYFINEFSKKGDKIKFDDSLYNLQTVLDHIIKDKMYKKFLKRRYGLGYELYIPPDFTEYLIEYDNSINFFTFNKTEDFKDFERFCDGE